MYYHNSFSAFMKLSDENKLISCKRCFSLAYSQMSIEDILLVFALAVLFYSLIENFTECPFFVFFYPFATAFLALLHSITLMHTIRFIIMLHYTTFSFLFIVILHIIGVCYVMTTYLYSTFRLHNGHLHYGAHISVKWGRCRYRFVHSFLPVFPTHCL